MHRGIRWAAVCIGLVVASVGQLEAQGTVPHVVFVGRVNPLPEWKRAYERAEKCYGKPGDFDSVEWYITNAPMVSDSGDVSWGLWKADEQRRLIIIVGIDSTTAQHEALHDILYLNGWRSPRTKDDSVRDTDPEHPMPPFGKCAFRYYGANQ